MTTPATNRSAHFQWPVSLTGPSTFKNWMTNNQLELSGIALGAASLDLSATPWARPSPRPPAFRPWLTPVCATTDPRQRGAVIAAQRRPATKVDTFPMTVWNAADETGAAVVTPTRPRHVGARPGLS
jgi:hypothetical protein